MKILFVLSSMPVGGMEILIANLATKLKGMGNEVGILTFKKPQNEEVFTKNVNLTIFSLDRKNKFDFFFVIKAYKQLKGFKPTIIVSLSEFAYFFIELVQRICNLRTPHLLAKHSLKQYGIKNIICTRLFFFFAKAWGAYYIFVSHNQRIFYQGKYDIPKERIFVIHNGVDVRFFSPEKKEKGDTFTIIHIANVRLEKDQWTLLKSLSLLDAEIKNWKLIFVANNPEGYLDDFKNYLDKHSILHKIMFIHEVDRVRIKQALSSSDVFILTSISEVFPMAALEAMAMGLPCVLTDVGGCAEIIEDNNNGYLVEPKDHNVIAEKLKYLYNHPDLLQQMGMQARSTAVNKFSLDKCAEEYFYVFQEVMDRLRNGNR